MFAGAWRIGELSNHALQRPGRASQSFSFESRSVPGRPLKADPFYGNSMGTHCSAHIELLSWGSEPEDADALWRTVVVVGPPLVDRHYLLFCRLFGVRCADLRQHPDLPVPPTPIARGRGLPANAAPETRDALGHLEDVSWATAAEVEQAFEGVTLDDTDWGWRYVRDSMRLFAEKMGPGRVRMIMGFW